MIWKKSSDEENKAGDENDEVEEQAPWMVYVEMDKTR